MKLNIVGTIVKLKWIGLFMLVLLVTSAGIFSWVNFQNQKVSQSVGDIMYNILMNDVNKDEMIKVLSDVIKNDKSNYQYFAKFKLASIYTEDKIEEAQVIYAELADNEKLIPELRELARYLEIITLLKTNNTDLLKDRIQKLLSQKSNVYKSSNKEIAAISMIKDNNLDNAVSIIKEIISTPDSDAMVYKNAIDLLQIYDN
ncbi:hypothetical protein EDL79_01350 [Ehrlichia ruminantium]|uniref:Tetratricopeptide repeat-like domain-containing protein n=1 Tax=Ehrlichia ruminantium TaxID=779 RepID=A0AAE6QAZ6_EHRRU|nr:hypothetical protein [Ehrlichia ruminantium]QGR02326.1 hypothetical protein EDL81_01350 [Ehrlichia ruminantium]QGR03246.1 hypothetical protein EDL80_01350 [Ehrlichia ruminantium]QGR04171.1 hypothetical protein EDL79_01350 [Ehrlichia ruminantium]